MTFHATHPIRAAAATAIAPRAPRWNRRFPLLGLVAVVSSGAAWAAFPPAHSFTRDDSAQWRALGVQPLSSGGDSGLRMVASDAVEPIDAAPVRATPFAMAAEAAPKPAPAASGPIRISGRVGDGLYWALRSAGATPDVAAQYLSALATQIDVGEVGPDARFDLVLGGGQTRPLLYAGLERAGSTALQLVRWSTNGRDTWVDAADAERPAPAAEGMMMPVAGHITSYFGTRYHPILHFSRFHAGLDIGAVWGSPIVAAGDGQVVRAGWAGGYGRQVQLAHPGGMSSSYSHMSQIAVAPGTYVRRGQVISYVGSSGLSTGPHLHFEVRRGGTPINPLGARMVSAPVVDPNFAGAVKARLTALLSVGQRG